MAADEFDLCIQSCFCDQYFACNPDLLGSPDTVVTPVQFAYSFSQTSSHTHSCHDDEATEGLLRMGADRGSIRRHMPSWLAMESAGGCSRREDRCLGISAG